MRSLKRHIVRFGVLMGSVAGLAGCRKDEPPVLAKELARKMTAGQASLPDAAFPLPYRLYVPPSYDRTKAYPLVVFLHGSGSNGTDNIRQLVESVAVLTGPAQQVEPAFVLAPHCPSGTKWMVRKTPRPPYRNYDQSRVAEGDAARLTRVALSQVRSQYNIDPDRIYITGPSAGGTGTWDAITRHPELFAAAVPITGANDPSRAPAIAHLAIWAFHGADDATSPVDNTREMVRALQGLGSPVKYSELEGVGHRSWDQAYVTPGLFEWLFAQRRSKPKGVTP